MATGDYGPVFARAYDRCWTEHAARVAPELRRHHEALGDVPRALLDVSCGTGQLCLHFLEHGYRVTGIDLSPDMIAIARAHCADHVAAGRAAFFVADAASFAVGGGFGLAVSTYNALNHLPDLDALRGCFRSVREALAPGGGFVFDLNTRAGLRQAWNGVHAADSEGVTAQAESVYDGGARAFTRISGTVREEDGRLERFDETLANTAFALADVHAALLAEGFTAVRWACDGALAAPVEDAEALDRVVGVARRPSV